MAERGQLHHIELWVEDLAEAQVSWGWLLGRLGYRPGEPWAQGRSWTRGEVYVVLEAGPACRRERHDRLRPGLNHLAFVAGTRDELDALVAEAPAYGWTLMFADRHPFAAGPQHCAAYLENDAGFEVELVATDHG